MYRVMWRETNERGRTSGGGEAELWTHAPEAWASCSHHEPCCRMNALEVRESARQQLPWCWRCSWDILGHPSLPPPPPPLQAPERFVELDPEMAQTLMDQRDSGKQLLLITNR